MKRYILQVFLLLLLSGSACGGGLSGSGLSGSGQSGDPSPTFKILGVGDSIALGYPNDPQLGMWPQLCTSLSGYGSWTSANHGVGGYSIAEVDAAIASWITSESPTHIFIHAGIWDVVESTTIADSLTSMLSILGKAQTANAYLVVDQLIPYTGATQGANETNQNKIKLLNAALEKWCWSYNVRMCATYQEMCNTQGGDYEDDLLPAYDSNDGFGIHPNQTGQNRMGVIAARCAVPQRMRLWGDDRFPLFGYESWDWWVLSGSASISGDGDTGTLVLTQNDTADSPVLGFDSDGRSITISTNLSQGAVVIKYRTASSNFNRNAATSWTTYSVPFTTSNQFVQIRLENTEATTALVHDVKISWN